MDGLGNAPQNTLRFPTGRLDTTSTPSPVSTTHITSHTPTPNSGATTMDTPNQTSEVIKAARVEATPIHHAKSHHRRRASIQMAVAKALEGDLLGEGEAVRSPFHSANSLSTTAPGAGGGGLNKMVGAIATKKTVNGLPRIASGSELADAETGVGVIIRQKSQAIAEKKAISRRSSGSGLVMRRGSIAKLVARSQAKAGVAEMAMYLDNFSKSLEGANMSPVDPGARPSSASRSGRGLTSIKAGPKPRAYRPENALSRADKKKRENLATRFELFGFPRDGCLQSLKEAQGDLNKTLKLLLYYYPKGDGVRGMGKRRRPHRCITLIQPALLHVPLPPHDSYIHNPGNPCSISRFLTPRFRSIHSLSPCSFSLTSRLPPPPPQKQ